VGDIPPQALLSGYEVVDDIRETDIGASHEAKEANKEESDIFDKSEFGTSVILSDCIYHCWPIKASVELDTDPTKDMKRSSLGMAAAKAKVNITMRYLSAYSAFR